MLALLDRIKPVHERQPEYLLGLRGWKQHVTRALRNLGRTEDYVKFQREIAESGAGDLAAQVRYTNDLAIVGEFDAAYAWFDRQFAMDVERINSEYDRLFTAYYDLLNREGRYAELVPLTVRWLTRRPDSSDACQRHLGALIYADRTADADAQCLAWLTAGRDADKLDDATRQRLFAAAQYATGYVYGSHYHVMDPKWLKPLDETARFFVRHEHNFDVAQSIIGNHLFSDSHEADGLRNWLFGILLEEAATLEQSRLSSLVQWCLNGPTPEATDAGWKTIADALLARWEEIDKFDVRSPLGNTLLSIYGSRFADQQMPFMRTRIKRAPDERIAGLQLRLFNLLLQQSWQDELEAEAFTLLPLISSDKNTDVRFGALVEALHRLVDRVLVARQDAAKSALQDKEHPEELTRHELAQKYREFLVTAREGVAARLATETKRLRAIGAPDGPDKEKSGPHVNNSLADWLQLERMTLDVQLARNFEQVRAECWAWLGEAPPVVGKAGEDEDRINEGAGADGSATEFPLFDAALRQRAFAIVSNLAVRKSTKPESRKRLIDYVQIGVDRNGEGSSAWKAIKYQMLVALDEPQQLERDLREWIRTDEYATPWRRSLAKLVAEQGEIDEAIGLYETIERDSQLSPSDYAVLSDWYLVVDRRDRYKRSKIEAFKVWQEYQISGWINQQLNPWQRTDQTLPSELDENVLFAFQALFEKSNNPGGYLSQLRQFYTACRDFRLLNMLADSVVGRTPQQVYSFLNSLRTTVLEEVRDESTADEILGQVNKLRDTLEQPGRDVTVIDLRALDLLEAMIERRASEVLNQPGPHVDAAVAALQRAFERDWAAGEPRQMAELLKNLGRITQQKLADEQLREFKALYATADPGTDDRLWIGWYYGDSQYSSYGLRDPGLALVESAMREYEATHPDGWPTHANVVFSGYVTMLTGIGRHTTAERYINRHLENPLNESQIYWLTQRMDDVYIIALSHNGQVSLGSGETLYKTLLKRLLKATDTDNPNHRYQTLQKILSTFTAAKNRSIDYKDDLRKYAFEQLPPILERQTSNYRSIVDRTAHRVKDLIDTRTALEFLITRFENYPKRLRNSWEHPWQQFGWRMSDWRRLVGDSLGDLEPRLLKIVLAELRRDLRTRNQRSRYMYHDDYGYFWHEKRADFARVAEEVYAEVKHSRRYVEYIAQYIYHGLASNSRAHKVHSDRAIEMMLIAHGQHLLEESGQATLCQWLHRHDRYAESIPILEPMVERRPDTMDYRCRLITAYHHTQRFEQRDDLLVATNEHFRQGGRWMEHNVAQLANCTRLIGLYEQAIDLYGEVIPLHQRTAPNRGIGNDTLSSYYRHLADAHSHLGHTKEAVDAASGSVISWGPRYERRAAAIAKLREVLSSAKDLDAYVAFLDEQLEETGQTSPLLRKTIGAVYVEKGEHQKSIPQLRLSLELQPGDMQTHKELLKAYDALEDAQGAIDTVLAQLDLDRHNLALYTDLANRMSSDMQLAERAATTIVESAPSESEHHAALAVHRESQQRWSAAIEHWKHAARLRALEPTNLLKLAEAQIKGKQPAAARKTLDNVTDRPWPSRFDNDIRRGVERLQKLLQQSP